MAGGCGTAGVGSSRSRSMTAAALVPAVPPPPASMSRITCCNCRRSAAPQGGICPICTCICSRPSWESCSNPGRAETGADRKRIAVRPRRCIRVMTSLTSLAKPASAPAGTTGAASGTVSAGLWPVDGVAAASPSAGSMQGGSGAPASGSRASSKPGNTTRPSRSIRRVAILVSGSMSAESPSATMRPSRTAMATACGMRASMVRIRPLKSTRSAMACRAAARSAGDGEPSGEHPVARARYTGNSHRLTSGRRHGRHSRWNRWHDYPKPPAMHAPCRTKNPGRSRGA